MCQRSDTAQFEMKYSSTKYSKVFCSNVYEAYSNTHARIRMNVPISLTLKSHLPCSNGSICFYSAGKDNPMSYGRESTASRGKERVGLLFVNCKSVSQLVIL